jgi:hypothetical protein
VSQRFNRIVIPLLYQQVIFGPKLVSENPDSVTASIIEYVLMNCWEASISKELDWDRAFKFLSGCRILQDLRYAT